MSSMLDNGRTAQKRRTHATLVKAALALLRAGESPTVSEVARAARVSPATAYRYFPSARALWTGVLAQIGGPSLEEVFDRCPEDDLPARVDALVHAVSFRMFDDEALWRTAARLMQDRDPTAKPQAERIPVPTGKRLRWIEHAIAPLSRELPRGVYRRLTMALALVIGAESVLALRDVCGLEPEEAKSVTRWTAQALLKSAQSEGRARRGKRVQRRKQPKKPRRGAPRAKR
jgi:AcrR family transcriptional regulator